MTEEMNPDLPSINMEVVNTKVEKRRLTTVLSSEPTYYNGKVELPADVAEAHAAVERLRTHARRFLGEGGNDIFSAQYLKMFAEKAAGKRLRIKIEMTAEDIDE